MKLMSALTLLSSLQTLSCECIINVWVNLRESTTLALFRTQTDLLTVCSYVLKLINKPIQIED